MLMPTTATTLQERTGRKDGVCRNDDPRGGQAPYLKRALARIDRLGREDGPDVLIGGPGDDRIWPGRGKDDVLCGKGRDVVHPQERPADDYADCESFR